MSKTLPLHEMTLQEKLAVMESIWEDLRSSPRAVQSPSWHKKLLDRRRQRVKTGNARFLDWETAKAGIRKKLT
jgi:hypothetical protein